MYINLEFSKTWFSSPWVVRSFYIPLSQKNWRNLILRAKEPWTLGYSLLYCFIALGMFWKVIWVKGVILRDLIMYWVNGECLKGVKRPNTPEISLKQRSIDQWKGGGGFGATHNAGKLPRDVIPIGGQQPCSASFPLRSVGPSTWVRGSPRGARLAHGVSLATHASFSCLNMPTTLPNPFQGDLYSI